MYSMTAGLQTQHPEVLVIISVDFNHVNLDSTMPAVHQYVDCPTRNSRTIDLLYTNVRDAYSATPLLPLGKSDHNLVYLQPRYTPLVRRQPITTLTVRKWTPEAEEVLRDCFSCTD